MKNLVWAYLVSSLASLVHGAYVQAASCHGERLKPWELNEQYHIDSAKLENQEETTQFFLVLGRYLNDTTCEAPQRELDVAITVDVLGSNTTYRTFVRPSCSPSTHSGWPRTTSRVVADLQSVPTVGTLHTTVQISSNESADDGCLKFDVTPAIPKTLSAILKWTSLALLVYILLVNATRTWRQDQVMAEQRHSWWSDVAECLSYLQFVFLTSCLSLQYPGFLQPLTSNLHWFSLFNRGPLNHGVMYAGVRDGIYEINGTYGGTFGFEHMHQIVGAPMTADTWWNCLIALSVFVGLSILLFELARICRSGPSTDSAPIEGHYFSDRLDCILRVVLSCFTLPLCSMAFYQVNYAKVLPIHHIISAGSTLAVVLAALIWLGYRPPLEALESSTSSSLKRSEQCFNDTKAQRTRRRVLIIILLATTLLRGAIVGGLQHYDIAQLVSLLICEILTLLSIATLQPQALRSRRTALVGVRLVSLAMLCCFIPGATTGLTKDAVGYALLVLHAMTTILAFFVPCSYQLAQMSFRVSTASADQAAGDVLLAQDKRTSPSLISLRPVELELRSLGGTVSSAQSSSSSGSTAPPCAESSPDNKLAQDVPDYFRAPRATFHRTSESVAAAQRIMPSSKALTHANGGTFAVPLDSTTTCTAETTNRKSGSDGDELAKECNSPIISLGPRWHDFSFRESDLVYGAPADHAWPAVPENAVETSALSGTSRPASVWGSITSRTSVLFGQGRLSTAQAATRSSRSGFQVLRPAVVVDQALEEDPALNSMIKRNSID